MLIALRWKNKSTKLDLSQSKKRERSSPSRQDYQLTNLRTSNSNLPHGQDDKEETRSSLIITPKHTHTTPSHNFTDRQQPQPPATKPYRPSPQRSSPDPQAKPRQKCCGRCKLNIPKSLCLSPSQLMSFTKTTLRLAAGSSRTPIRRLPSLRQTRRSFLSCSIGSLRRVGLSR